MLEQRIQRHFFDSADLKYAAAETLARPVADAVGAIVGCITAGGKVLACGNGGSAADAQHFAAEFVGRFERERPGLAAIALTTSGNSANVLAAVEAAKKKEMTVVALTGNGGGKLGERLGETDVHICVPHERTVRIQEVHLLVVHCLCDAVDLQLMGEPENA